MNEAFSDIWAACITNYAKLNDPTLSDEIIWRLFEKSTKPFRGANAGSRDMQNPLKFNQPSTYHSTNWVPGDYVACPVETDGVDDHSGVHQNSGVLNKWFYLITDGEIGINSKLQPYAITGLGFAKTEKIAYLMELNLTPNAGYATAMDVSLNIAATEYGYGSDEYQTLKNAWYAVGVNSDIYNMANVPAFTTNNFTSIETDGTNIFAGTNYNGLYQYDGSAWKKMTELTDVRINDIKLDMNGDFWIAQSGKTGTVGGGSSIGGGVNYLKSPFTSPSILYTVNPQLHVPSRNARCIYIDPLRQNDVTNPKVWVATLAYITSGSSTSGMLGQGLYTSGNEFKAINQGINISTGTVGCATVGGLENEIWTFVQANNGINQLLQYHAGTNSLISTYDHNSVPALPSGFVARAIYGDAKKRLWVGLANGGVMLLDEKKHWHQLNFPSIFPAGTAVNFNAITGDSFGDVYIGTTAGLVFFDHGIGEINRLDDSSFYRLYTKSNGLPSSNINALSFSTQNFRLYVATDSGIVFWHPLCIGNSCNLHRFYTKAYSQSKGNGNWSDPTKWSTGIIPDSTTIVVITDTITVDINAQCQSLSITNPGSILINTGNNLKIFEEQNPINTIKGIKRRQQR
jgi:sugar lactone lactonase YvrE